MDKIKDELRELSRYIRDILAPLVARGGENNLNQVQLSRLYAILTHIDVLPMSLDLLRYSRIHKALIDIAAAGKGWPLEVVIQADDILMKWEITLGPLQDLQADLWGPGGRLEGLKKIKSRRDADEVSGSFRVSPLGLIKTQDGNHSRSLEGTHDPTRAHATGDLGFPVGA